MDAGCCLMQGMRLIAARVLDSNVEFVFRTSALSRLCRREFFGIELNTDFVDPCARRSWVGRFSLVEKVPCVHRFHYPLCSTCPSTWLFNLTASSGSIHSSAPMCIQRYMSRSPPASHIHLHVWKNKRKQSHLEDKLRVFWQSTFRFYSPLLVKVVSQPLPLGWTNEKHPFGNTPSGAWSDIIRIGKSSRDERTGMEWRAGWRKKLNA